MKKLFIVANWKEHKTVVEAKSWIERMAADKEKLANPDKEVVVCSPFSLLSEISRLLKEKQLNIKLGSQDFPAFEDGAHTGEEPPELLKEFIQYAIIGHSERRKELGETDELIANKVSEANKYGITPILCVQGIETPIPAGVTIVAYEPVWAIGSGHPETAEADEQVARSIKEKYPEVKYVLCGGSVTPENVHEFTQVEHIDGALVGGASLDPDKFLPLITNA